MRSSEYTDEIPRKAYSSENTNEYPRIYYSPWRAVGDFKNSEEILRKEPLPSVFRRNFLGTVGSISSINARTPNLFIHSISSSSHILYLHTNLIEKNMSSSNYYRSWIDRPHLDPNTRLLTEEYQRGITEFMGPWRAVGDFKNSEEILRKEPLPSVFRRNFLGTVGSISSINARTPNLFIHSISSSSHILYLHTNLIEKNMSSSNYYRSWIDRPHLDPNTRLLTEEYQRGITEFMGLVQRQPEAETGMLRCPCSNCKNRKIIKEWDVWTHLYLNGFTRSYKIWYHHGETDYEYGSTSEPQPAVRLEEPIRMDVDYGVGTEQM
uniref:Transposase-associated domain-containing protein n=1 Tax=Brassica oleracea var. oleracea TaxID=109376 RepID=A0A0D3CR77_BRAOL